MGGWFFQCDSFDIVLVYFDHALKLDNTIFIFVDFAKCSCSKISVLISGI